MLMKKSAFEEKKVDEEQEEEEEEANASNDAVDSENVNELSDLFSTIENEFGDNSSAIDFSVLLEGEHAFNVEEVSEIFSDLEDTAVVATQDVEDAAVVDQMAALFSSLSELPHDELDTDSDRDSTTVVEEVDEQDAENVDELSDLFSALEEQQDQQQASQDWIASLDVEDVSGLYSGLEQLQQRATPTLKMAVDPRIFVPTFSIRMDGAAAGKAGGAFLAGPPGLLLAGPPVHRGGAAGGRMGLDEKRKAAADPSISATRRVCAAKRRRVNGRFVREQNSFVSITALQPSP